MIPHRPYPKGPKLLTKSEELPGYYAHRFHLQLWKLRRFFENLTLFFGHIQEASEIVRS